jgi:hypothetical protein
MMLHESDPDILRKCNALTSKGENVQEYILALQDEGTVLPQNVRIITC